MNNTIRFFGLSLLVAMILLPNISKAKDPVTITWYMYDLPPYHILRGKYHQQGPLDYVYSIWQKWLPEYIHKPVAVNTTRMKREFQSDRDYRCITSSFKFPESLEHWVWSKALYAEPPAVAVVSAEVSERFSNNETINFTRLLEDNSIKFGHFDGRIYLGEIDKIIQQHIKSPNVISVGTYAPGESLMRMLQRGRVDYIIEYLPEINWLMLSGQLEKEVNYVAVNIENHTALSPVYVGCANTLWGRKTIDKFNAGINDEFRRKIWKKYERWLYNDFSIKRFRSIQEKYFLNHSIKDK